MNPYFQPDDPFVRNDPDAERIYIEKEALARTLTPPRSILEIGVRAGYSAAVWLSVWPQVQYHGIDSDSHESGGWPGSHQRARAMLEKHFPGRWKITIHDTQRYDAFPQGPCDLVYVDADHTYDGCLADLYRAAKITQRIWVDDLKHHANTVGRAVQDFLKDRRVVGHTYHDTVRGDVLIDLDNPIVWSSGGDLGDLLAQLRTVHAFGPASLTLVNRPVRRPFTPQIVDQEYRPFLEKQPYLTKVLSEERSEPIDLDFWRKLPQPGLNSADAVAKVFNAPSTSGPWLFCDNSTPVADVVINRTFRYRSGDAMWHEIMKKYPSKVFLGLEDEWKDFEARFGTIPWHRTGDFWQVAQVVSGAKLVCCNQSSIFWLASGLGLPTVLEVDRRMDHCRLDRPGATYFDPMAGDPLVLPDISAESSVSFSLCIRVNGEEVPVQTASDDGWTHAARQYKSLKKNASG